MNKKKSRLLRKYLTPRLLMGIFVIGVLFFLSFDKIIFFAGQSEISLFLKDDNQEYFKRLFNSYFKNKRLFPLVSRYTRAENNLALFFMEMLKNLGRIGPEIMEKEPLLSEITQQFPENLFLDYMGFYDSGDEYKKLSNFDILFFSILMEGGLNNFSYEVLTESYYDRKINWNDIFRIILFLDWQENFFLADYLFGWAQKEAILEEWQIEVCWYDSLKRKGREGKNERTEFDESAIKSNLRNKLNEPGLQLKLGKNLIADGSFAKKESLRKNWIFSDHSDRAPFAGGSFFGGLDSFEGESMRIMGFFVEKIGGKSPPRGGYLYRSDLSLGEKYYLLFFRFKALTGEEEPSLWLSSQLGKEIRLPSSRGEWKECYYILNNNKLELSRIRPLFRMWGTGSVFFDDISFYELTLKGISVEKDLLIFN